MWTNFCSAKLVHYATSDKVIVLMRREPIASVNIILGSQHEMMTVAASLSEVGAPISAGPWIPMKPDSQQGQDLSEDWQGEEDD